MTSTNSCGAAATVPRKTPLNSMQSAARAGREQLDANHNRSPGAASHKEELVAYQLGSSPANAVVKSTSEETDVPPWEPPVSNATV